MAKKIISILMCIILILPTVVFADDPLSVDKPYEVISGMSKTVLNILSWAGYVIAFGMLIFIGIKYMLSAANERANLKSTIPMYIGGIVAIVLCSTIASGVANIASSVGDNSAEGVVSEGLGFKDLEVGDVEIEKDEKKVLLDFRKISLKDGYIKVNAPERVDIKHSGLGDEGKAPIVKIPAEVRETNLRGIYVRKKNAKGKTVDVYFVDASTLSKNGIYYEWEATGTDGLIDSWTNTRYEIWTIYEGYEYILNELPPIDWANGITGTSPTLEPDEELPPMQGIPEPQ